MTPERAGAADPSRTPYFAYGSNMDVAAMATRCPGAVFVSPGRLEGHAFRINRNHHATILPAAGKRVHGVLWTITPADQAALDEYEGVAIALYRRHEVPVTLRDGGQVLALTYMARNTEATPTSGAYFEAMIAAARRVGLPAEYVVELESWRADGNWDGQSPGPLAG